ncbi:polyphosphate polymerase domain-containing protein [Streptococcus gallolyticus subsp. gallolyticus]|uniref:polyphosphate polymerase domain-containing protein n=1 Tax=Streptococcus gallolyticus TaxID=315405 RepID=UPI00228511DD|nr:polyphosphate polymerase domain-containing protein [Streptococcus gallolyticus]MCY7202616.1 polyphosphate polymerase domain-containing protein [Streptococcus gallolyticus subsp. gallolyticus]
MVKALETSFKRIEKKYVLDKEKLGAIWDDLKEHLVEDDYPTSTITNIYFDTADFQVIQDSIAKKNSREKIRMRTYVTNPTEDSQAFLELKKKDAEGIGHKFRLVSETGAIKQFIESGKLTHATSEDQLLIDELNTLKERYGDLSARMLIYYERSSFKEKHHIKGQPQTKIRVTVDQNVTYRDYDVEKSMGNYGSELVGDGKVIMEIKTPGPQPEWLQAILMKHGIESTSFSKYGTAYRKSQGIV